MPFPSQTTSDQISAYLNRFLLSKKETFGPVNRWGNWLPDELKRLNSSGKMHRGQLVVLTYQIYINDIPTDAVKVAAAMELVQGSVLVHDDIIDRDLIRRGRPTVAAYLREEAKRSGISDWEHIGDGMAIAAADLGFFLAFEILSDLSTEKNIYRKLVSSLMECYAQVALGEMADTWIGASDVIPEEKEILSCYRYKTARYSFSLPLICGAYLAGVDQPVTGQLDALGQDMGILFQLKDDELGLFGDTGKTGKPVGADILEGKKTLYLVRYLRKYPDLAADLLTRIRKQTVTPDEIGSIKQNLIQSGIRQEIAGMMNDMKHAIVAKIHNGEFPQSLKEMLNQLLQFIVGREK